MRLKRNSHKGVIALIIVALLGTLALAACDGRAVIDVNFDATEGVGNIIVTGDQDGQSADQTQTDTTMDTSQVLLFGLIVALLLGTIAIVISLARRPRYE